ncbi:MAG: serine hydrolase [Halioglobus sp.]
MAIPKTAAELGLMEGAPPPPEKRVNKGNFTQAPYNRWALQHIREIVPTREILRGDGSVSPLRADEMDLGKLEVALGDGRRLTVNDWLQEAYTDGFAVLHNGVVVYERYFNSQTSTSLHQMFSASKSFAGTMLLVLAEQGLVDLSAPVAKYLPELKNSAYGDATVQQVLDMTVAIKYSEDYSDVNAEVMQYGLCFGIGQIPEDYPGPTEIHDYLPTLTKQGNHGEAFHYVTPDTDVVGWIVRRVTGMNLSQVIQENLWSKLGVESDAYYWLDHAGTEMAAGGLSLSLRDAARFGQMILQDGFYNGQQILPSSVAKKIKEPGNPDTFNRYNEEPDTTSYAYHDQWWTMNNDHKAVSAIGVYGQFIYIDPVANMILVKQTSHSEPSRRGNEADGPKMMHAIAKYLVRHGQMAKPTGADSK